MKIIVILAHPDENSLNAALAKTVREVLAANGYLVIYHDLYREEFDPLVRKTEFRKDNNLPDVVLQYCQEVMEAQGMVIIHPNWWGQPPAILTGWIDQVLRPGVGYRFLPGDSGEGVPEGLLQYKAVVVLNTSDTPVDREEKVFGDPLERIWRDCIFGFCGVQRFFRKVFRVVVTSTYEQRQTWLTEASEITNYYFPRSHPPCK